MKEDTEHWDKIIWMIIGITILVIWIVFPIYTIVMLHKIDNKQYSIFRADKSLTMSNVDIEIKGKDNAKELVEDFRKIQK